MIFRALALLLSFVVISCSMTGRSAVATRPLGSSFDKEILAVLGPGDVVDIRVFDENTLSGNHQIDSKGSVILPLVGRVKLSALTPEEAARRIADRYEGKYLKNAEVSVFVTSFNSRKVLF